MEFEETRQLAFYYAVDDYIRRTTVMKSYLAISPESRAKYVGKLLLEITVNYSPKRYYDVDRATLRDFIVEVLEKMEKQYQKRA